jgi:hypothetical protein
LKTIYLHAGAPKTGTSSIQNHLARCSPELEPLGLYYPVSFNDQFDYPHRSFISTGNANPLAYSIRHAGDPHLYSRFSPAEVLRCLENNLGEHGKVLLSHEDLLFSPPRWLETFRSWADKAGYRVVPIIYIRDQLSWHISNYQQHVRQLMSADSVYQTVGKSMLIPEWTRYIGKFARIFGEDELVVRLFRRDTNNNIVLEFLSGLGIDNASLGESTNEKSNVGISSEAAVLTARVQRFSREKATQRQLLQLILESEVSLPKFEFPREVKALLESYYRKCNEELCEKYLPTDDAAQLRRLMLSESEESADINDGSLTLAADILSRVLGDR